MAFAGHFTAVIGDILKLSYFKDKKKKLLLFSYDNMCLWIVYDKNWSTNLQSRLILGYILNCEEAPASWFRLK